MRQRDRKQIFRTINDGMRAGHDTRAIVEKIREDFDISTNKAEQAVHIWIDAGGWRELRENSVYHP